MIASHLGGQRTFYVQKGSFMYIVLHIDSLVQDCSISSGLAMEVIAILHWGIDVMLYALYNTFQCLQTRRMFFFIQSMSDSMLITSVKRRRLCFHRCTFVCLSVSNITQKWILMKFSAKGGHETRNNLRHNRDVTVNPLNSESIFLFPGSVFVSNIMEKRINGFLSNIGDDTINN